MATLKPGVCSKDVLEMQKNLNKVLGKGTVKENGDYDEATSAAVAKLQKKAGLKQTGVADALTLDAAVPRVKITLKNGNSYFGTQEECLALAKKAKAAAAKRAQGYVSKAKEARGYYDAHDSVREDNWFWSGAVDLYTGASFPPESIITAAEQAAKKIVTAAGSGSLSSTKLDSMAAPITKALNAMSAYRKATFDGGAAMVDDLVTVRDSCVFVLEVAAAAASGGTSTAFQVGIAAGVGGVKGLMGELDKAPSEKVSGGDVALGTIKGAVVDGAVTFIMKNKANGMEKFTENLAKKAVTKVGAKGSKEVLKKYAEGAIKGAADKAIEDGIKGVGKLGDPKTKITKEAIMDGAVSSLIEGAALGAVGKKLDAYGKGASKKFKGDEFFKGLGKVDHAKAYAAGGTKLVENSGKAAMKSVMGNENGKKKIDVAALEKDLQMCIIKDPKVVAWAVKAAKEHKKK